MEQQLIPYCGHAPLPGEWLARWNGDPLVVVALAVAAFWAWRARRSTVPFWWGLACLAFLFISPICALSSALFSVRVVHHVILTAIAAPLLAWGLRGLRLPGSAALWAAAHAVLFWLWHAPRPYGLALSSDALYWVMQASLLASAVAFWSGVRRAPPPLAVGLLLAMMVQMGLLGALITFAGTPLYAAHFTTTIPWGLTALEDQQLAGVIMWAPAAAFYLAAALWTGWHMLPAQSRARP